MNIGDMVTLSAAALSRDPMYAWSENARTYAHYAKPKPIGLVVDMKPHARIGYNSRNQTVYVIKWITPDAPKTRSSQYGWIAESHPNQFYRGDLKFVSRRKPSKK